MWPRFDAQKIVCKKQLRKGNVWKLLRKQTANKTQSACFESVKGYMFPLNWENIAYATSMAKV